MRKIINSTYITAHMIGPGGDEIESVTDAGLLEREDALAALSNGITAALSGTGSLVLLEGPAGLGKTELVAVACEEAARNGLEVLRAHGGQVERDVALGAARQLFAPISALPADERSRSSPGPRRWLRVRSGLGTAAPTAADVRHRPDLR